MSKTYSWFSMKEGILGTSVMWTWKQKQTWVMFWSTFHSLLELLSSLRIPTVHGSLIQKTPAPESSLKPVWRWWPWQSLLKTSPGNNYDPETSCLQLCTMSSETCGIHQWARNSHSALTPGGRNPCCSVPPGLLFTSELTCLRPCHSGMSSWLGIPGPGFNERLN